MRYMIFTWMQVIDLPLPIHSRAVTRVHERRRSSVVNLVIMVVHVVMMMKVVMRVLIMLMRDWNGDGNVAYLGDKIQTGSAMLL